MENPGANFVVDPVPYRAVPYSTTVWKRGEGGSTLMSLRHRIQSPQIKHLNH